MSSLVSSLSSRTLSLELQNHYLWLGNEYNAVKSIAVWKLEVRPTALKIFHVISRQLYSERLKNVFEFYAYVCALFSVEVSCRKVRQLSLCYRESCETRVATLNRSDFQFHYFLLPMGVLHSNSSSYAFQIYLSAVVGNVFRVWGCVSPIVSKYRKLKTACFSRPWGISSVLIIFSVDFFTWSLWKFWSYTLGRISSASFFPQLMKEPLHHRIIWPDWTRVTRVNTMLFFTYSVSKE